MHDEVTLSDAWVRHLKALVFDDFIPVSDDV